jgi:hypothetical protein
VIPEDFELTRSNALNVLNPTINARERWRSIGTAALFGKITIFKTVASPILGPFSYKKK